MKRSRLPISSCPSCRQRILASFGIITPARAYTRPTIAPKVTIDIKHIRRSPGLYEENCVTRRYDSLKRNSWRILDLSETANKTNSQAAPIRGHIKQIHAKLKTGAKAEEKAELVKEAKALQPRLDELEGTLGNLEREIQELAEALPNLTSRYTPIGDDADEVGFIGKYPEWDLSVKRPSHVDIGLQLDILDFEGAATTSGWGWYYLKNEGALLEHALVQYALSVAMKRGWKLVSPPSMVYAHIADACGFQPRDQNEEQQIYAIQQSEKDKAKPQLVMAGTAEIPLAGMKAKTTFTEADLPLKTVGVSRCYRAEAGARGVDTKGLYRVHEFTKVEMFAWTVPDQPSHASSSSLSSSIASDYFEASSITSSSETIFAEMLSIQTEILTNLGLHARILEMPTHDLGASATRKRDIEAFFPSRTKIDKGYGEVTSASMCTDYQSRRLATRVRLNEKNEKGIEKLDFAWTVNGTAVAVPRVLACILENFWDAERQVVVVPGVLRPFLGGLEEIGRK